MKYCTKCGAVIDEDNKNITAEDLPEKYRPLGAWKYFWIKVLFSVPIVGLIFAIVWSFGSKRNVNKRNFARAQFCSLILVGIILLIFILTGAASAILKELVL